MTRGLIGNMSIKNVILKSGEQLICDVKEGFMGEKLICYQLNNPCLVIVNDPTMEGELEEDGSASRLSVFLYPWPQLSAEKEVKIALDLVVTIVEPTEDLKTLYTTKVLNNGKREDGTESDNDDSAD